MPPSTAETQTHPAMPTIAQRQGWDLPSDLGEDEIARGLIAQMTLEEKVEMMSGHGFFEQLAEDDREWGARPYRAGSGNERLGIPPLYFTDGPRGVTRKGSTCFPCSMARGATFDEDLEFRIGQAIGVEARARGCTFCGAVCINLLRHPAWGRAQETYGEDQWHLGVMGAALGTGIQSHNVVGTVKHFALNSMENARFKVDVQANERAMHEVYLPHFKHCLDAGVATVMGAYNKVNGEYCGHSKELLTDILRGEWGFDGFVHSDWVRGVREVRGAAAGLDVENPEPLVYGEALVAAVENGEIAESVIDEACTRILRVQIRFARRPDPVLEYHAGLVASPEHIALAREAALKAAVLVENDGTLPLNLGDTGTVAVLGRLADMPNTGDNGSSKVVPDYVVTPLDGFQRALGVDRVVHADEFDLEAARRAAALADSVVVVVGYTAEEEGEYIIGDIALGADQDPAAPTGNPTPPPRPSISDRPIGGDRSSLSLPEEQIALIRAAARSGRPVTVVIVAGSAVTVEEWRDAADAIVFGFYAGMEGGNALAELLLGKANFSGRLPFTVARNEADYPFFDRDADAIEYGYWHGYAKFDREAIEPRYAFGFGLSYTQYDQSDLTCDVVDDAIVCSLTVANIGRMEGEQVVQAYVGMPSSPVERPLRSLRGFTRVALAPGEQKRVEIRIPMSTLRIRNPETHTWELEPGTYRIGLGASSRSLIESTVEVA